MRKAAISFFVLFMPLCFASQSRQLLDFKMTQASWLEQYPVIQQKVEKIIAKNKMSILKDAKKLFLEFPKTALLPYKLHIRDLKLFRPDNHNVVSVRMSIYTYTGGAHGGTRYYSWNWNQQRKKFLSLDDVISSSQFAVLVKETRRILFERQKQGDEYDKHRKAHVQRGVSKKKDFKIWNLDRNGILFVFPEYQVASYAAGSFEVSIPLDSLQ